MTTEGDRPKFPTTDKWYRYVGDENMNKLFNLKEGHSLVFKIPIHELQACKWQWYKTLQWLGKTHEYRLSMDMPREAFTILRRPTLTTGPITASTEGPPSSFESSPGTQVETLSGGQADLIRMTFEAFDAMPEDERATAVVKCLQHPETLAFIKEAVRKHYVLATDPSPTSTDQGERDEILEREDDDDFIDGLGDSLTEQETTE